MIIKGQRDKGRQNTTEKTKNRAIRRHKIDGHKRTKRQTILYKTLYRKGKIE
jgi:hypothetical protein